MKIIDRYLGRELIVALVFAVAVLNLVLVVSNIFRKLMPLLVNRDVPAEYLFAFVGYILPYSLTFAIPWGILTAVLLVFGRFSADQELAAFRTNGISLPRICASLFVIAALLTVICLWLTLQVAPAAREKLTGMMFDLATRNPMALFESDQVIDQFAGRKIYVGRKHGNQLENIIVFETDAEAMPLRVTHAHTGTLETDLPNQRVLMHLYGARYQQRDERAPHDLNRIRDGIALAEGTLPISLAELYERTRKRSARSALSLRQLIDQLQRGGPRERSTSRTEINKRFAFPFSCVAFAFLGVPLGVTAQRRERSVALGMSLLVALGYFLFIILADTLREKPEWHPEFLVWVPNFLFIGLGGWLFWRLAKR